MRIFSRRKISSPPPITARRLASGTRRPAPSRFGTIDNLEAQLRLSGRDISSGRWRAMLYRFLTDHVPAVSACIWTWSRLTAAPGHYRIVDDNHNSTAGEARRLLGEMSSEVYLKSTGEAAGLTTLLVDMLRCMFRDGHFGGFLTVRRDASGVDKFIPVDPAHIEVGDDHQKGGLVLATPDGNMNLSRPDFFHLALNAGVTAPLGRSVLQAIPFVTYIEQQLVDDMRRSSHNAGYHRVHVKVAPPERMAGEADRAYTDRINSYFDSTVSMMRSCEIDDNPVTWDNVSISYIGPENTRSNNNQWFQSHRAMIEEICAGTHLAPFLLGYSYGDTTTWAAFKFDMVMRQVRTIQAEVSHFLSWLGNIHLALNGLNETCEYEFDNSFAYQATEKAEVESRQADNILRLYEAGLIDEEAARRKAGELL